MPIIHGKSNESRSKNIATEIKAGKDPKQAAAIGYSIQREARKDGSPHPVRAMFEEVGKLAREHYGKK